MTDFLDIPIINAIEYFSGMIVRAMEWATLYGRIFGLVGLVWSAFQLVNSRLQVKDFLWNTLFKWTLFFFLMSCWGMIINFFSSVGNEIGLKAGGGTTVIEENLNSLYNGIIGDKEKAKNEELDILHRELVQSASVSSFANAGIDINKGFDGKLNDSYLDTLQSQIENSSLSGKQKRTALDEINEARARVAEINKEGLSKYEHMIITGIDKVTSRVYPDGSEDDITKSYVVLNIWMLDKEGHQTIYLSPASMIRLALLCCEVRSWKVNNDYDEAKAGKTSKLLEGIKDDLGLFGEWICNRALGAIGNIVLIVSVIFAIMQYIMTILEYTIISGLGAIFIPLVLFDGTKDIPKKLVPVFINMTIKFIVMVSCLIFVFWIILNNTTITLSEGLGGAWTTLTTTLLNALLCYVLTSNAPQIAQTILTGQPQLSMGELVQAGFAAVKTAKVTGKAVNGGAKYAGNKAENIGGKIKKIQGATKFANENTKGKGEDGKLTMAQKMGNLGMATGAVIGDGLKQKGNELKNKQHNWLKGNSNGGVAGGVGGKGSNPYGNANANFKTATTKDENGNVRSMSGKEFRKESYAQGQNVMEGIMGKQDAKKSAKEEKKMSSSDSLKNTSITGNQRQTSANAQSNKPQQQNRQNSAQKKKGSGSNYKGNKGKRNKKNQQKSKKKNGRKKR